MNTSKEMNVANQQGNRFLYVTPRSKVIEIQGTNAILTGSIEPGRVPGFNGQSIDEDDTDY